MQLRQENVWPEQIPFDVKSMKRFIESFVRDCRLCWEMTAMCRRMFGEWHFKRVSSPKELHATFVEHTVSSMRSFQGKDKCDFKLHIAENKTKIDCWCNYNTNSKIIHKNVPILNVWGRSVTLSSGCSWRNVFFVLLFVFIRASWASRSVTSRQLSAFRKCFELCCSENISSYASRDYFELCSRDLRIFFS